MKNKEIIKRVEHFIDNLFLIAIDAEINEIDYSHFRKKRYFAFTTYFRNDMPSDAKFYSKREINKLINDHFYNCRYELANYIVIFDIENNKIVRPHI